MPMSLILDIPFDRILDVVYGNLPWAVKIIYDGGCIQYTRFRPFFYVICPKNKVKALEIELYEHARGMIFDELRRLKTKKNVDKAKLDTLKDEILNDPVKVTETDLTPFILNKSTYRYERRSDYVVLKVETWIPKHVPALAQLMTRHRTCSLLQ